MGLFAVFGKPKYQYRPRSASWKTILYARFVVGQTVQAEEHRQTNGQTDVRQTDRRYQTYYLPCFAVDNQSSCQSRQIHFSK